MSKNMKRMLVGILLVAGVLSSAVYADLGLGQTLSEQGVRAVGESVKAAAEAIFAAGGDPAEMQAQLTAILNEAVATGDEGAIRYAIVAVMMAGGEESLDLFKAAINASDLAANHPGLAADTIAETEALITGGDGQEGGGNSSGGGGGTGKDFFDSREDVGETDESDTTPVTQE